MRFILGYMKNTKSEYYDGPKLIWQLNVKYKGNRYFFKRLAPDNLRLAVYDTKDYPEKMLNDMFSNKHIMEFNGDLIASEVDIAGIKKG